MTKGCGGGRDDRLRTSRQLHAAAGVALGDGRGLLPADGGLPALPGRHFSDREPCSLPWHKPGKALPPAPPFFPTKGPRGGERSPACTRAHAQACARACEHVQRDGERGECARVHVRRGGERGECARMHVRRGMVDQMKERMGRKGKEGLGWEALEGEEQASSNSSSLMNWWCLENILIFISNCRMWCGT